MPVGCIARATAMSIPGAAPAPARPALFTRSLCNDHENFILYNLRVYLAHRGETTMSKSRITFAISAAMLLGLAAFLNWNPTLAGKEKDSHGRICQLRFEATVHHGP